MTGLGLIGIIPAYKAYKNAKKELESLEEQQEGLQAAIATYNSGKLNSYLEYMSKDEPDNVYPDGLQITTMLRVGNLVGKMFQVHASIVISNTGNKTYRIGTSYADCNLVAINEEGKKTEYPVIVTNGDQIIKNKLNPFSNVFDDTVRIIEQKTSGSIIPIKPGSVWEFYLPHGVSSLVDTETGERVNEWLRDIICQACGKSLITSCPKVFIEDIETANIRLSWTEETEGVEHTCILRNKPGTLRYCGEAYYPTD